MITQILLALIGAFVLLEIIEHVLLPLLGIILGRKTRSISGAEGMVGKVVKVREWNQTEGKVRVNAELWKAVSDVPLSNGDKVVVSDVRGLTLRVEPFQDPPVSE
jgi:membrane-bound serine protease (ClpP class)